MKMLKIETPVLLVIALVQLIVRGTLNVRNHQSDHFKRAVTDRRLKVQTEGWRDGEIKVCDDPENKGKSVVLAGNISVCAALEGFNLESDIWDKLIPDGKVTVRNYGKLTPAQMDFIVMDHGEVDLTLSEVYEVIERAYLADRSMSVDDLSVRFNDILHKVLKGRKVELTGNEVYDRKAIAARWRGTVGQNFMPHIQMRAIGPVYADYLAELETPDSGLFSFKKNEYTKLHKAWKLDREAETLENLDEAGFPPEMSKAVDVIMKSREDKANKTKAPATHEATPLSAEKLGDIKKESPSITIKILMAVALGETVPEFAELEKALVKAEKTKGNPLFQFFNAVKELAKA